LLGLCGFTRQDDESGPDAPYETIEALVTPVATDSGSEDP